MRSKRTFLVTALVFAITLAVALPVATAGDEPKFDRLDGWVEMIDTDLKKISLRTGNDVPRYVFFGGKTAYTYRNEPAAIAEVQVGRRVICLGTFDIKGRLQAERIDVRVKD
ncbi:MAG: hypothetical protein O2968_04115 [Acidobacteria bacterium]|nr:hypothetical protein [Acidobacteriota bacterium]